MVDLSVVELVVVESVVELVAVSVVELVAVCCCIGG